MILAKIRKRRQAKKLAKRTAKWRQERLVDEFRAGLR
jgi:hypothetical protein